MATLSNKDVLLKLKVVESKEKSTTLVVVAGRDSKK